MRRAVAVCCVVLALSSLVAHARAPVGQYETFGADDVTIRDGKTKLTWDRKVSVERYTWAAATAACNARILSGKTWRLPTAKELLTIVDQDVNWVYVGTDDLEPRAIDKFAFPDTPGFYFWTSTKVGSDPFVVDFRYGNTQQLAQGSLANVRCVAD
jgi:hypothetical protein